MTLWHVAVSMGAASCLEVSAFSITGNTPAIRGVFERNSIPEHRDTLLFFNFSYDIVPLN